MTKYRVYFNRHNEFPQVWSIDEGDVETEVNVKQLIMVDVRAVTHYDSTGDNVNTPKAWFEVHGRLEVRAGVAYIFGE